MGWTSYMATEYKNGKIDRKAECDKLWTQEEHDGYAQLRVLKSTMKGSTYYAAVEISFPTTNAKPREVIGMVCLTSVRGREFGYKDMPETMHPFSYECPMSIIDLLTPTNNQYANEWRQKCRELHADKSRPKIIWLNYNVLAE